VSSTGAEEIVLDGVLIPVAWKASGKVAKLVLMTFDEREHAIDPAAARDQGLEAHLRRHVRLRGVMQADGAMRVRLVEILDGIGS
jgi:hypothetical protein